MSALATPWPSLPFDAWRATKETLHRYTQLIGKIQLALTPAVNHFWNVTLHVTARGLATSALRHGTCTFDIELDLIEHRVVVRTSDGERETRALRAIPVADFRHELFDMLASLGIDVHIWDHPVELKTEPIAFSEDRVHAAYDPDYVTRFHRVLTSASDVLEQFRSRFAGKCSGVGFYWGTFDLSCARYSGRAAPDAPTANAIEREAYSHELSEVGFWPGDAVYPAPAFFAFHYPAPDRYARAAVQPAEARWEDRIKCFVLPYEECRERDLSRTVLEFFQTTYEAGANTAGWQRGELERSLEPRGTR